MKLVNDTLLLFGAHLRATLRNPIWIILGLFQPVCYLLLFAPLLEGFMQGAPEGQALRTFAPGLLILTAMFNTMFVGFGLIADLRAGVVERLRVTPVSRLALPLGMVLRDILMLLVQSLLMIGMAVLLGLRVEIPSLLLALVLVTLIGLMMAPISYSLALIFKDEDALAGTLNFFSQPLLLLSGVLLPLTFAPPLLKALAAVNPFSHAVDATRALFDGNFGDAAVLRGFIVMAVLAGLTLWWAVRSFRQATT